MMAQRKYEEAPKVVRKSRKRKRVNLLRMLIGNHMVCIVVLAVAVSFVLSVYVSAYARATENGYEKSRLQAHLKAVNMENESMKLILENLQQPERVESFAVEHGMQQGSRIAYIVPVKQPHVARNTD